MPAAHPRHGSARIIRMEPQAAQAAQARADAGAFGKRGGSVWEASGKSGMDGSVWEMTGLPTFPWDRVAGQPNPRDTRNPWADTGTRRA